ncbi:hypothetical protein QYF61_016838 [Mycteria americana]|uniref:Uncharacterized protein n=1 Tax=Mycteria americana TaxID=33587 RepID=A0AAN7NAR8_MYCAM|nr:hypothetical protein QYF61_016838 [Mycteria americana]
MDFTTEPVPSVYPQGVNKRRTRARNQKAVIWQQWEAMAKQPQFPQPLLIRLLLQTLHQLHCPSLDTLQHLNVSLVVRGPKLNTGFEAAVNQYPQVLLCWAAFQPLFPKPVALHGVAVTQVQDLALGLVEPHTFGPSPWIQPVQVPLQSLPTLKQINTPAQLGVICKLTEGALDPFIQIIDKDIKQNWLQHRALGNTICDRPPTGVNSIHHNSLGPAIQPGFYPAKSTPVQAMSSQLVQENAVQNVRPAEEIIPQLSPTTKGGAQVGKSLSPQAAITKPLPCLAQQAVLFSWGRSTGDQGPPAPSHKEHRARWHVKQFPRYNLGQRQDTLEGQDEQTNNISETFKGNALTWAKLRGWRLHHFPGQPLPMLDNPFSEVKFPKIQSKPPLAQLEAISSRPITCYLGEETDPHLSTTSFQAKQPQFPQPPLIRLLLQTLHQLRCPSLDTLQPLNVSLVVRGPKLNTGFEVRPHRCRVQGHDHFPSPAGHTISDTSQDAIGLLGHLGTLLAHIQAAVNQYSQVLLCWAAFQPLFPKPVALPGVAVAQVQDLALGLVEPHTFGPSPSIQPVQVPLQSLPTLQQINTPTQLGVICKLTEGALDPLVQIIDNDIKQNWPQHRALGNTTCDRPPTGVNSIHHHSLGPAIQPVLYPAKSTPVQAMSSQFLQENARAEWDLLSLIISKPKGPPLNKYNDQLWRNPILLCSVDLHQLIPALPPQYSVPDLCENVRLDAGYLELVAQARVQTAFEYRQGWRLHNLRGPALSRPHSLFIKVRLKCCLVALSQLCIHLLKSAAQIPNDGLQPAAKNGLKLRNPTQEPSEQTSSEGGGESSAMLSSKQAQTGRSWFSQSQLVGLAV